VGDVSGKGVPASLFMAGTIRLFRALAKFRGEPAEIATYMNNELTEGNDSGMFVTMFIGRLNLDSGQLTFCNCGHNPPVLGCGSADAAFLQMETNAPIGIVPDIEYAGETIADVKDQPLFVYTDGLNEAENVRQEQFGDEHLLEVIQQRPFTTARELIDTLTAMVEEHRKGAEPNDDLTMFCLSLH
jgi:serine phosphatase RsbU (regulator of sigma subunit)